VNLLLRCPPLFQPDRLSGSDRDSAAVQLLAQQPVETVNHKSVSEQKAILHPRSRACIRAQRQPYFDGIFSRRMENDIPSSYAVKTEERSPESCFPPKQKRNTLFAQRVSCRSSTPQEQKFRDDPSFHRQRRLKVVSSPFMPVAGSRYAHPGGESRRQDMASATAAAHIGPRRSSLL
jgi:hypothetical protein